MVIYLSDVKRREKAVAYKTWRGKEAAAATAASTFRSRIHTLIPKAVCVRLFLYSVVLSEEQLLGHSAHTHSITSHSL